MSHSWPAGRKPRSCPRPRRTATLAAPLSHSSHTEPPRPSLHRVAAAAFSQQWVSRCTQGLPQPTPQSLGGCMRTQPRRVPLKVCINPAHIRSACALNGSHSKSATSPMCVELSPRTLRATYAGRRGLGRGGVRRGQPSAVESSGREPARLRGEPTTWSLISAQRAQAHVRRKENGASSTCHPRLGGGASRGRNGTESAPHSRGLEGVRADARNRGGIRRKLRQAVARVERRGVWRGETLVGVREPSGPQVGAQLRWVRWGEVR